MRKNYIIFLLTVVFFSCKHEKAKSYQHKNKIDSMDYINTKNIDKLGETSLLDSAKLFMYLYYAEEKPVFQQSSCNNCSYFSLLDIKLVNYEIRKDTANFSLFFVCNDSCLAQSYIHGAVAYGVSMNRVNNKVLGLLFKNGIMGSSDWPNDIYQSKHIEFLQAHKSQLNPWLRKMIVDRGIIK